MRITPLFPCLVFPVCALATSAAAESFDGSKTLLCATVETIECGTRADCMAGSADSLRFPQFLNIDAQNKRISATRPDGTALNAAITQVASFDDRLVLQGVENSLGWSISINRNSGRMTAAIAGDQVVFTVFGACTLR